MRITTSRRRLASTIAVTTGLGVMLSGFGAGAASAAEPFTDDQLAFDYPSNADYDYVPIMDQFSWLVTDRADIIALNDSQTVDINNSATPEQVERAIVDQYDDMSVSMADGLGENLGAIYTEARLAGELPKIDALLAKSGGLVGYYSSSNPSKNYFDYDRPYIRFPELLQYRDKDGGDAWDSTSGAYPSGHTSQAYWQGTSLSVMLPELAPQILARTAEAGNNRIVMAAHYPLDVMSGRMMGQHIVERRMSDPAFRELFAEAEAELRGVLEAGCGAALADCIAADSPYLSDEDALAVYEERMSYAFPQIAASGDAVTIPANAESLLITSHPDLTPEQRRQVLELTAIDSGYPLDEGTEGSWQRLNLAAAMAAVVQVNADGTINIVDVGAEQPEPSTPGTTEPPVTPVPTAEPTATATAEPTASATTAPVPSTRAPAAGGSTAGNGSDALATTGAENIGTGLIAALALLVAGATALVLRKRSAKANS
ncbi:phosphatase PAP2 family protein [Pseudoclavibacter sp. AY1F1]|uniref:acid phosphatase n=1 Tax=Pseudoclavibacter sp. AY1F1 TaxID=2080583 RepID=UPI000CE8A966|nr:phosphatase PAP2 family protein [Pseudoclavibacter sp. AY1F1]PPF43650.1 phosphatase PAP2 family protein [Pseudoclavibacter sp. AY1F1]